MSLTDAAARASSRLGANNPALALGGLSQAYSTILAILAYIDNSNFQLNALAQQTSILSATGDALDALGANVGTPRGTGTPGKGFVTLTLPNPATTTQVFPGGEFMVGTDRDGVSAQSVTFTLDNDTTIGVGQTTAAGVPVTCTVSGVIGNVSAGAINQPVTPTVGLSVTNPRAIDGTNGTTLGTDKQSDTSYRTQLQAAVQAKYGTSALVLAMEAIDGVFDAYVYDPASVGSPSGFIYYAWAMVDGTAPSIAGGSTTVGDGQTYITGATLSGLAATVDTVLRSVCPPGVIPRLYGAGGASAPFNVVTLTQIHITYQCSTAIQSSNIEPRIQAAVAAYVNSLQHNQALQVSPLFDYVQKQLGRLLTGFNIGNATYTTITATTPASSTAAPTTLYRLTGNPLTVVVMHRL